ncbi:hypothetical protein O181_121047 [Austropuccinia psidii MF-1]|uniref:Uncharacterized protein n=1 Tax=Austropuccinia psidii MF-1 TaxID=1389203 RepID=A0A9Q3Q306_9BASI|nr:hypothetical protein [Austropuccinia psidii MF-1]
MASTHQCCPTTTAPVSKLPTFRRTIDINQGTYRWDATSRPTISSDFGFSWDTALNRLRYGHQIPDYWHCEDPKKNRTTSHND